MKHTTTILTMIVILSNLAIALPTQTTNQLFYQGSDTSTLSNDVVLNLPMINTTSNSTYTKDYSKNNVATLADVSFFNQSYTFNGINSSIIMSDNAAYDLNTNLNLTVAFWIKADKAPDASQFIINRRGGGGVLDWDIYYSTAGNFVTRFGTSVGLGSITKINGTGWRFVTITYDRNLVNNTRYYFDGVFDRLGTENSTSNQTNAYPVYIGRRLAGNYFNGSISNVLVFNRSLSAVEVRQLYAQGRVRYNLPYIGGKDYLVKPSPFYPNQKCNRYFTYTWDGYNAYNIRTNDVILNLPMRNTTSNNTYTKDYSKNNLSKTHYETIYVSENNSYEFNSTRYISISTDKFNTCGNCNFSIAAWVKKATGTQATAFIYSRSGGTDERIYLLGSNYLYSFKVGNNGNETKTTSNKAIGGWDFVVGVAEGNKLKIYLDGTLNSTFNNAYYNLNEAGNNAVGSQTPGQSWNGSISNVLVFNRSLSASEVASLYSQGRVRYNLPYVGGKDFLVKPSPYYPNQKCNRYFTYTWDGYNAYNIRTNDVILNLPMRNTTSNNTYTKDYSKKANNGIVVATMNNTRYEFNGVDNYINLTNQTHNFHNLTYMLWVKTNTNATTYNLLSGNINFRSTLSSSTQNRIQFTGGNPTTYSISVPNAFLQNTWYHVAVVIYTINSTSGTQNLYLNGVQIDADNFTDISSTNTRLKIGTFNGDTIDLPLNGSISNVLIFNRSLSAVEVSQLYVDGRNT